MKKTLLSLHLIIILLLGVTGVYANHSLSFDGIDDYAEVANSDELAGIAEITVSAWVNPLDLNSTGVIAAKWSNPEGPGRAYTFRVDASGAIAVNIRTENGGDYAAVFNSDELNVGQWAHVAFTYSSPDLKLFLNGNEMSSTTTSGGDLIQSTTSLRFGNANGLDESYEGFIDDVTIWNVPLSGNEIQSLMNQRIQGDESNLIGYWNFNAGTGTSVSDLSSNNNGGTIVGATWSTDVPPTPGVVSVDDVMVEELTLSFTSFQAIESSTLVSGKDYYLKISGSYSAASGHSADAAYYYSNTPPAAAMPWTWNGINTQHPFPQGYNSNHIYYYYFTSDGTTETFGFEDTVYGDNSGVLTIQIWRRAEATTVTDIDGNVYQTINIGDQEWMMENLKVTHYRDGTAISNVTDNALWGALTTGAYCFYNNNSNNGDTYGALYNWDAATDAHNIAPEGWRVPTDTDWQELEIALGMSQSEADGVERYRGTNEGSKLAGNVDLWDNFGLESNPEFGSSGFNALPGGYRSGGSGAFSGGEGYSDYFWSATEMELGEHNGWWRHLRRDLSTIYRGHVNTIGWGMSVRCLKNETDTLPINTHSLIFDGVNDYIPYIEGVEPNGSLSLCAWFKSSATNSARLISKTSSENIFFLMVQSDGALRFNVMDGQCITTSTFLDDQWHFAVGVWDGTDVKIYVDGQLEVTSSGTVNPNYANVNTNKPFIGSQDPTWENFDGLIDEISVWDVALSASQIQSFYTDPISGSESGLVGHWDFDEGSGSTVNDVTGNGYNGTIVGAVYSSDVPFTGSTTTSELTWSLQVQGSQASTTTLNDVDNYLGVAPDASNGFDAAYDEAEPPTSPGSSLSLYFPHSEWGHALGDDFSSDIRPEIDLTDTMQVWDFEVVSTDEGNVSLTFQYTDIPDVPVVLENEDTGERVFLVHNESYDFTAVANMTYFFRVSIGDTTAPQVHAGRSFSGPSILRAGHLHDLDFFALDGFMVDQMDLLFSSDSGDSFEPFATFGDTTAHPWFVPENFDNVLYGAALQIKAIDYAGNSATAESDYVLTIASDSLFADVYSGWTLWGAPLTPFVDTMEVNIDDDFAGYWTTYDYVDNGYTYDGFLNKGAGYWLGTLEDTEVDVLGEASTTDEDAALDLGWNLLSNPLVLDVSLDSMMVINGNTSETLFYQDAVSAGWVNSIYEYDGNGYVTPAVIQPWKGYWFSALIENLIITFPIHKHGEPVLARDTREEGWGIQLFASTSNGAEDNLMMIGSHPEATDGFDNEFDEVRPPSAPGSRFVQLDVSHPEWAMPLGDSFVRDIRAENSDGSNEDWTVHISSSEDDVNLTWDISQIPEEYSIGIDSDGDGSFQDLTGFESLSIEAGTSFTLRVGADALAVNGIAIPTEYLLNQNYPNPFNPTTTVKFGLPEVSDVKITVYDIQGREVVQLVNSVQKSAGYHTAVWNGLDATQNQVSTGLYFTRIEAGDFSKTIKMLFLK